MPLWKVSLIAALSAIMIINLFTISKNELNFFFFLRAIHPSHLPSAEWYRIAMLYYLLLNFIPYVFTFVKTDKERDPDTRRVQ